MTVQVKLVDIWTVPEEFTQGDEVEVHVRVRNEGDPGYIGIHLVCYYLDKNGNVIGKDDVGFWQQYLEPGKELEAIFKDVIYAPAGTYKVQYCAEVGYVETSQQQPPGTPPGIEPRI